MAGALHEIGDDRRIDALDRDRRLRLDVEGAAHLGQVSWLMRSAAGRRRLLHARGDVDGDAADAGVAIDAASEQHAAGVHAHPHGEGVVAICCRTCSP